MADAAGVWLLDNRRDLLIALAVAIASMTVLLWVRRLVFRWVAQLKGYPPWEETAALLETARLSSLIWAVLLSLYLALQASPVPEPWRTNAARVTLSLFILATGIYGARLVRGLTRLAGQRFQVGRRTVEAAGAVPAAVVILLAALGILQLWGAPTAPLLVAAGIIGILLALAARDALPSAVAAFQVTTLSDIKEGDYIRLDTGVEGVVEEVTWRSLALRSVDGSRVIIPNRRLAQSTVTNYGRHFKKAKEPFRFYARSYLRELTGLKARNISELSECLRTAPESSIYYHTHLYLEEHQYLAPTPANAFAEWVGDALGNRALGEQLATVDVVSMASMEAVRERFLGILQEAMNAGVDGRSVLAGGEFHFLQAAAFITPCGYEAGDLRELVAVLRRVPASSLYFHMFESRLLSGGRTANDVSRWLRESMDEPDLAREVERFNPYDYTLEGLRSSLIRSIESRLA
jgi:small-conductance mechanosensitive channel